jgi:polyhydroxyalkanoate synthesis regulator phasin
MASSKAAAMSPEARRQAEQVTQEMIDEFVNKGKVTKCAARWALGAVPMSLFGTDV